MGRVQFNPTEHGSVDPAGHLVANLFTVFVSNPRKKNNIIAIINISINSIVHV